MSDRNDEKLRALFREVHEQLDPPAPPIAGLLHPTAGGTTLHARRSAVALASAVALVLIAGALWLILKIGPSAVRHDEAFRLAAELGEWEAPTDFLLQTPGIEFFEEAPRFGAPLDDSPDETIRPTEKEIIQ